MSFFSFKKRKKGFSLIEMLIVISIFSLIIMSFYRIFSAGTQLIVDSKKKLAATNLATERIEIIRSLDYSLIGTDGGVPDGDLVPDEYVEVGVYNFHVYTDIVYIDDADDGTEAGGTDDEPNEPNQPPPANSTASPAKITVDPVNIHSQSGVSCSNSRAVERTPIRASSSRS